ncbi:MAG: GatB/YqeY domain-containing protein [Synergistaceae bacterium]|nr:GatB/YqeY domain-containing protein [Synergistaceae bacterium]
MTAMKQRREMELSSLRLLKAELQMASSEKGHRGDLSEDEIITRIQKLVKQRRDASEQYAAVGAPSRAENELKEAIFLETYLPEQLGDAELERIIEESAAEAKATGPKDAGKIMGKVMPLVKGLAEGNRVKTKVQRYLQSLSE